MGTGGGGGGGINFYQDVRKDGRSLRAEFFDNAGFTLFHKFIISDSPERLLNEMISNRTLLIVLRLLIIFQSNIA